MKLAGYQPQYFPRLHYVARMLSADVFEFSDYVQFVKKHKFASAAGPGERGKSYQADTPIKLGTGLEYLTVPAGQHGKALNETDVSASGWERKHLKKIALGYRNAANFKKLAPQLERLLDGTYTSLAALNIRATIWALAVLSGAFDQSAGLASLSEVNEWLENDKAFPLKKIVRISDTAVPPPDDDHDATAWIIDMCREFGASEYVYGGTSAAAYMNFDRLQAAGITVVQQTWAPQPYRQQFPKLGFLANLSIIDLLMNEDAARVQEILRG